MGSQIFLFAKNNVPLNIRFLQDTKVIKIIKTFFVRLSEFRSRELFRYCTTCLNPKTIMYLFGPLKIL